MEETVLKEMGIQLRAEINKYTSMASAWKSLT